MSSANSCHKIPYGRDTFPTVVAQDASGRTFFSPELCSLYQCGEDEFRPMVTCKLESDNPVCKGERSSYNRSVRCILQNPPFVPGGALRDPYAAAAALYPYPYYYYTPGNDPYFNSYGYGCPASDKALCQGPGESPFCVNAYYGTQRSGDPFGCYVGQGDQCGLMASGARKCPATGRCLSSCCPGNLRSVSPYSYFYVDDPYAVPPRPWWIG